MKLMKRSGIYQQSSYNCTFNPKTLDAHSYKWWRFVGMVEGKLVASTCRYSVTTQKHQRIVSRLMDQLGIKVDLYLPLPRGVRSDQSLAEMIIEAEEYLCDQYLESELKREDRNAKSKKRRHVKKLEEYLETQVNFRDYDIADREDFASSYKPIATKIAVHQVVDMDSMERDVEDALYHFHRDGFGSIVFYV